MTKYIFCDVYQSRDYAMQQNSMFIAKSVYVPVKNGISVSDGDVFKNSHDGNYYRVTDITYADYDSCDYVDDSGNFCWFGDNQCDGSNCDTDEDEDCTCEEEMIDSGDYFKIESVNLTIVKKTEMDIVKSYFGKQAKAETQTETKEERGNESMNNNNNNILANAMPAFKIGVVSDNRIKMSISGLAIRGTDGNYLSYANGNVTDVTPMLIDMPGMIFAIPVAVKAIEEADIIDHQGKILVVRKVNDKSLDCIDVATSTAVEVLPVKNMFGFNFYTKYMNPMGDMFGDGDEEASEDNPFGGMGKIMMMQAMMGGGGMFGQGDNSGGMGGIMQMMMISKVFKGGGLDFGKMFG